MNFAENSRVLISILNWNGGRATLDAIRSIYESDYHNFSILVIDNASVDGSIELVENEFPLVHVLRNTSNFGFAGGQNQGIRFAKTNGYELIWILNNDTRVAPDTLGLLVTEVDTHENVGMVSPVIIDEGTERIQFCGCSVDFDEFKFVHFDSLEDAKESQVISPENFCIWGTAILSKTSVINDIDGFDEKYFAYYEDLDLSLRVIRSGYLNKIVPQATVYHAGINDPDQRPPHYVYFNTRNRFIFWNDHLPNKFYLKFYREYLAGALIYASTWQEKGDQERMQVTLLAIWHGIRKVSGPWNKNNRAPIFLSWLAMTRPYFIASILRGELLARIKDWFSGGIR